MTTTVANFLELEIPEVTSKDFQDIVAATYNKCDQQELLVALKKGYAFMAVRDEEKTAGSGSKGKGFLNWLKERNIGKTQAYELIGYVETVEELVRMGILAVEDLTKFTKKAFRQFINSSKEAQLLISQAAASGEKIDKEKIKNLDDQQVVCTSDLPDEIKEKATAGSIPPRYLAPLVKEMDKLPSAFVTSLKEDIAESDFDAEAAKQMAKEAKNLNAFLEKSPEIAILEGLDVESALNEAFRIGSVGDATNLVKVAQKINKAATDLYNSRHKLEKLSDRLYVDTGASTPNLRHLLSAIDPLVRDTMRVPVSQDKTIWIRISEENFSTSESPAPNPTFPDPHLEKVPHVWAEYVRFCEETGLDTKNAAAAVSRLLGERDELASALNIIEGRDREIDAQRSAIVAKQTELDEALAEREQLLARIAEMESRLTSPVAEAIAPIETKIEIVAPVEAIAPKPAPVEATEPSPKPQAIATKPSAPELKAIAPIEIIANEILKLGGDSPEIIKLDKATAIINNSATSILEISHDLAMGMAMIKFNLGNGTTVTRVPLDAPLQIAPDAIALVPARTKANGWQIDMVQLATGDRIEGSPQYTLEKAWSAPATAKKQRKEKNAAAPKADGYDTYENRKQIARAVEAIVSTKSEEEIITIPLSEPCYLTPETLGVKSKDAMTTELVINGQVAWKIQGEEAEFRLNDLLFDQQEVGDRVLQLIASYAAAPSFEAIASI